mmetsp:Transcript_53365/g.134381  ORF Transcript_53365/g.134381 Transcript_53365/m.134381 type:complete len:257 (+) Transcript_53365:422-1192(+)
MAAMHHSSLSYRHVSIVWVSSVTCLSWCVGVSAMGLSQSAAIGHRLGLRHHHYSCGLCGLHHDGLGCRHHHGLVGHRGRHHLLRRRAAHVGTVPGVHARLGSIAGTADGALQLIDLVQARQHNEGLGAATERSATVHGRHRSVGQFVGVETLATGALVGAVQHQRLPTHVETRGAALAVGERRNAAASLVDVVEVFSVVVYDGDVVILAATTVYRGIVGLQFGLIHVDIGGFNDVLQLQTQHAVARAPSDEIQVRP